MQGNNGEVQVLPCYIKELADGTVVRFRASVWDQGELSIDLECPNGKPREWRAWDRDEETESMTLSGEKLTLYRHPWVQRSCSFGAVYEVREVIKEYKEIVAILKQATKVCLDDIRDLKAIVRAGVTVEHLLGLKQ